MKIVMLMLLSSLTYGQILDSFHKPVAGISQGLNLMLNYDFNLTQCALDCWHMGDNGVCKSFAYSPSIRECYINAHIASLEYPLEVWKDFQYYQRLSIPLSISTSTTTSQRTTTTTTASSLPTAFSTTTSQRTTTTTTASSLPTTSSTTTSQRTTTTTASSLPTTTTMTTSQTTLQRLTVLPALATNLPSTTEDNVTYENGIIIALCLSGFALIASILIVILYLSMKCKHNTVTPIKSFANHTCTMSGYPSSVIMTQNPIYTSIT